MHKDCSAENRVRPKIHEFHNGMARVVDEWCALNDELLKRFPVFTVLQFRLTKANHLGLSQYSDQEVVDRFLGNLDSYLNYEKAGVLCVSFVENGLISACLRLRKPEDFQLVKWQLKVEKLPFNTRYKSWVDPAGEEMQQYRESPQEIQLH